MTKKHFIELADHIRTFNNREAVPFTQEQIGELADFCKFQNPRFDRQRWLDYIDGKCGPNGGKIE